MDLLTEDFVAPVMEGARYAIVTFPLWYVTPAEAAECTEPVDMFIEDALVLAYGDGEHTFQGVVYFFRHEQLVLQMREMDYDLYKQHHPNLDIVASLYQQRDWVEAIMRSNRPRQVAESDEFLH